METTSIPLLAVLISRVALDSKKWLLCVKLILCLQLGFGVSRFDSFSAISNVAYG